MERIYLDNAATTKIAPEVVDAMMPYFTEHYGNPSSTHANGRQAKAGIVTSRKSISKLLNCTPGEIIFTSGGTEADNMAILCAIRDLNVKHIITSKAEHKAVLQTTEFWCGKNDIKVSHVNLGKDGSVDMDHLADLINANGKALVSLMHANNEIGVKTDIRRVGELCKENDAYFHSDTVQTMAHYKFDLSDLNVDFATCSAHKFHGPKGNGFLYVNKDLNLTPMIIGGGQERNMRAGTENVPGIVGLAKALELAYKDLESHQKHVSALKQYMRKRLTEEIEDVRFNGDPTESGLYTVLSVCLPPGDVADMFLFSLDIQGVSASGGSACNSGSDAGSHVLQAIGADTSKINVRFSFSRYNSKEEIDKTVGIVKSILSSD